MDVCQLERLPDAGREHSRGEARLIGAAKLAQKALRKVTRTPERLVQLGLSTWRAAAVDEEPAAKPPPSPLGLVAGERVRVKSLEEIRRTLDDHHRCRGLGFMPVMERFCGRSFVVKKSIDRFFDERTRRLLKVRDVVILDDVFCEVGLTDDADYGGCDRTCFLFWKEDWLERAPAGDSRGEGGL